MTIMTGRVSLPALSRNAIMKDENVVRWFVKDSQSKRDRFPQEEWKQLEIPGRVCTMNDTQDGWWVSTKITLHHLLQSHHCKICQFNRNNRFWSQVSRWKLHCVNLVRELSWREDVWCASSWFFTFLMYAAISFSMLYFSRACVAHSTASCCMSSDMSAFLITAFLSDMVALGNRNTAEDSSSSQADWQTHNAIDSRPRASQQSSSSINLNGTVSRA